MGEKIELVGCPDCGDPAEVVDDFEMGSTDGPMRFVKVICVRRHWFMLPAEKCPGWAALPETRRDEVRPG